MSALKGSFSFIVAKRMLSTLEENGPTNKTNLAVHCRLNYNVCLKYINMLNVLGWVDIRHNKSPLVTITELGSEINSRLFRYDYQDIRANMEWASRPEAPQDMAAISSSALDPKKSRPPARRSESAKRGNILLVDDESDILLTYRSFLSSSGYNVEGFTDPYSALQRVALANRSPFDLIILDIRMPGINGLQLYQSLRIMSPSSRFLFVSSLDAAKELVTILPGVRQSQVLQKPVDKAFFVKSVQSILAS